MNIRVTFPPKKEKYIEPFMIQLVFLSLNLQSTKVVSNSVSHFLQPLMPERWNSQAGKVNGNKEEVKSLNSYLNSLKEKVHEVHRHLIDRNMPVTVENIKANLRGVSSRPRMVLDIFQHHNEQASQLVGKDFSPTTLMRYKTSLGHTKHFIKWKYNASDIDVLRINFEFVTGRI